MKYEEARKEFIKKKLGKCSNCSHNELDSDIYCRVRSETLYNNLMLDLFKIKFCRYFEEDK